MVAELTIGKEKYAEYEGINKNAIEIFTELNRVVLELANADIACYNSVMSAYCLTKDTEQEILHRERVIQDNLEKCTVIPYEIMKVCNEGLAVVADIFDKSNKNAKSDLLVAVFNLNAAINGAYLSIKTNLKAITNKNFVVEYSEKSQQLLIQSEELFRILN